MSNPIRVSLSIDRETLARVDVEARRRKLSRSGLFREAVLAALRGRQEEEIVAQLNETFSGPEAAREQQGEAERMLAASAARRLLE